MKFLWTNHTKTDNTVSVYSFFVFVLFSRLHAHVDEEGWWACAHKSCLVVVRPQFFFVLAFFSNLKKNKGYPPLPTHHIRVHVVHLLLGFRVALVSIRMPFQCQFAISFLHHIRLVCVRHSKHLWKINMREGYIERRIYIDIYIYVYVMRVWVWRVGARGKGGNDKRRKAHRTNVFRPPLLLRGNFEP